MVAAYRLLRMLRVASALVAGGAAVPAVAATFEWGECPKTHDPASVLQKARCDWPSVPENRSKVGSPRVQDSSVVAAARTSGGVRSQSRGSHHVRL